MAKKASKHPTLDELDRIKESHESLRCDERRLLDKRGWKYTSSTPGFVWMFQKTMADGRTLLVDQADAIRIERETCGEEYGEDEIEEF